MDHRSAAFEHILQPALAGVKSVLKTKTAEVFLFPATGTGGWETAITNTLSAGDKVLAARNGMFSHKWIDMCQHYGLDVQVVDVPWGEGVPAAKFAEILAADKDHQIKVVLATHNETATGVVSDIPAVRAAMDASNHPAMLFVDGVSSIGSMDFCMDDWGIDIAVSGSQKGFMLPAGMGIVAFGAKALAAVETATLPRYFFDIRDMQAGYAANGFPYTPPVGMLNGLKLATDMLMEEGLDNVFARHARMAEGVRKAASAWGMGLCAVSADLESNSVTGIMTPEGFDGNKLVAHASAKYGISFGAGLGDVAGKLFRIGHLGMVTDVLMLSGIATAEMCMVDLGMDIKLGSGVAAAQEHYRTTA
jgi:alanine-glyoxylate transaminase/serine-glyoxylate transaminase/serine-pyruvate transaminase